MRPVQIYLTNAEGTIEPEVEIPGSVLARKLSYCDGSVKRLESHLSSDGRRALQRIRFQSAYRKSLGKKNQIGSFDPGRAARAAKREDHTVYLYDEKTRTFPIGLLEDLREILKKEGIETEVTDRRVRPTPTERFELTERWKAALTSRDYQAKAVEETDRIPRRLHAWGTSSGKTLAIAGIIARQKVKTLVITANRALLHQMAGDLRDYLGFEPALFYGEKKELAPLTVGLADSVYYHAEEVGAFGFQMVVVDEARLSATKKYVIPEKKIRPYYCYGFDGTAWREGSDDLVLTAVYGKTRPEVSTTFLREKGYISDVEIHFEEVHHALPASLSWDEKVKRGIVLGKTRNAAVIRRVQYHLRAERPVLVLCEQVRHTEELSRLLRKEGIEHHVLTGETPDHLLELALAEFTGGFVPVMVTNCLKYGFNYRELGATINAAGLKGETGVWQKIGRSERRDDEGSLKYYDDFLDRGDPILLEWSKARMIALEEKGYKIEALERLRQEEAEEAARKQKEMKKLEKEFKAEEETLKKGALRDTFDRRGCLDGASVEVGKKELDAVV